MQLKAVFYRWKGTPERGQKEIVGQVWLGPTGRAVWDETVKQFFEPTLPNVPFALDPLNPDDGVRFIKTLPFVFRNAPYLWVELIGAQPKWPVE